MVKNHAISPSKRVVTGVEKRHCNSAESNESFELNSSIVGIDLERYSVSFSIRVLNRISR